jgi:RecG wedge domain
VAILSQLLHRLAETPEETRSKECRDWACRVPDATPIQQIEVRRRQKAVGVIQNIRIDPRQGSGTVEVTIVDGTGQLVAKWLGRKKLTGLRLGTGLIVEGMAGRGGDGELMILNPEYEIVPGPGHL